MENLEKAVREMFPNIGWEVKTGPNKIILTFEDYEVLITKSDDYYSLQCTKKEDEKIETITKHEEKNLYTFYIRTIRCLIGILRLYKDPTQ